MQTVVQLTNLAVDDVNDSAQQLVRDDISELAFGDTTSAHRIHIGQIVVPTNETSRRNLITGDESPEPATLTPIADGVDITVTIDLYVDDDEDTLAEGLEENFNNGTFLTKLKILETQRNISTFQHSNLKAYIIYGNTAIRVGGSSSDLDPVVPRSFEDAVGYFFRGDLVLGSMEIPWLVFWLGALAAIAFAVGTSLTIYKMVKAKKQMQQPLDYVKANEAMAMQAS